MAIEWDLQRFLITRSVLRYMVCIFILMICRLARWLECILLVLGWFVVVCLFFVFVVYAMSFIDYILAY